MVLAAMLLSQTTWKPLLQGDTDPKGRVVMYEVRAAPIVLRDKVGILIANRAEGDGPRIIQYVIAVDKPRRFLATFDRAEFLREAAKLPKGTEWTWYDKCTVSLSSGAFDVLEEIEVALEKMKLRKGRDKRIICVCSQFG